MTGRVKDPPYQWVARGRPRRRHVLVGAAPGPGFVVLWTDAGSAWGESPRRTRACTVTLGLRVRRCVYAMAPAWTFLYLALDARVTGPRAEP